MDLFREISHCDFKYDYCTYYSFFKYGTESVTKLQASCTVVGL